MQDPVYYESFEEALRHSITLSGLTHAEIARAVWPSKNPATAKTHLSNALNPDKDEKLTFDEIIQICKLTGRYDAIFYACDELSLYRPETKAPHDEGAELNRQFVAAVSRLEYLQKRMERNGATPEVTRLRNINQSIKKASGL